MMALEEAIIHAEEVADRCEVTDGDRACAAEHRQLAEWLRELAERRKAPEIIRCGECRFREIRGVDGFCDHITGEPIMVKKTDYCSWAERRTDG